MKNDALEKADAIEYLWHSYSTGIEPDNAVVERAKSLGVDVEKIKAVCEEQ